MFVEQPKHDMCPILSAHAKKSERKPSVQDPAAPEMNSDASEIKLRCCQQTPSVSW